jgi:hypothetical protein
MLPGIRSGLGKSTQPFVNPPWRKVGQARWEVAVWLWPTEVGSLEQNHSVPKGGVKMYKIWDWMRKNYDWSFLIVSFVVYTLANNPWPFVEAAIFWKKTDGIVLFDKKCGQPRGGTSTSPFLYRYTVGSVAYESSNLYPYDSSSTSCVVSVNSSGETIKISYNPFNPYESARAGFWETFFHFYIIYIGVFSVPIIILFFGRRIS